MFLLIRHNRDETKDYFGPFPSASRAGEYGNSFDRDTKFEIIPLIVPNCVTVRLNY